MTAATYDHHYDHAYHDTYDTDTDTDRGLMVCTVTAAAATTRYPTDPRIGARLVVTDRLEELGHPATTVTTVRRDNRYVVTVIRDDDDPTPDPDPDLAPSTLRLVTTDTTASTYTTTTTREGR